MRKSLLSKPRPAPVLLLGEEFHGIMECPIRIAQAAILSNMFQHVHVQGHNFCEEVEMEMTWTETSETSETSQPITHAK